MVASLSIRSARRGCAAQGRSAGLCLGSDLRLVGVVHRAKTGLFSWSAPSRTYPNGLETGYQYGYNWLSMGQCFLSMRLVGGVTSSLNGHRPSVAGQGHLRAEPPALVLGVPRPLRQVSWLAPDCPGVLRWPDADRTGRVRRCALGCLRLPGLLPLHPGHPIWKPRILGRPGLHPDEADRPARLWSGSARTQ